MMQQHTEPRQRDRRLPAAESRFDWLYAGWVILVVASTWVFLGAPVVVALASLATRLRRSRGKQVTIWVVAVVVTIITALPLLAVWFGWSTTTIDEHRFVVN